MMTTFRHIAIVLVLSTQVQAEVIEVGDTGITFVAPNEFSPIPQDVMDIKWLNKNAPGFAVGNEAATTTIAYDVKLRDISNIDMNELREVFEATFDRMIPGIQWKRNEVIQHDGKEWVYLEMTSNAIDTDIYNIMMVTSFGKRMVIFNFNSTREDFAEYESVLRASLETIRLPKPVKSP